MVNEANFAMHILVFHCKYNLCMQLSVWNTETWEKKKSIAIQLSSGKAPAGDTRVQFNSDQTRLLVVRETQLAIYDASKIERIHQVTYYLRDLCLHDEF